jgi:hypothetical protein
MDQNDRLILFDASHNDAVWYNVSDEVSNFLKENWRAS